MRSTIIPHHRDMRSTAPSRAAALVAALALAMAGGARADGSDYEPMEPPPFAYITLGACVLVALVCGALLANSRLQLSLPGYLLYHRTLAAPPRRRALRRLLGPIVELTLGEAAVVLLFAAVCAGYGVHYYMNAHIPHPMARVAHAFAGIGYITMALALLPVARNSLWLRILGLPLERALKYHRWVAELFVVAIWVHGLLVSVYVAAIAKAPAGNDSPLLRWSFNAHFVSDAAGLLAGLLFVVIAALSAIAVRRSRFELFYYAHHLFVPSIALTIVHTPKGWPYVVPGAALWLMDKAWRTWDSRCRKTRAVSLSVVGGLVRLEAAKREFSVRRPGQYVFLCVPAISPLQWHPFSLSSAPAPALAGTEGKFTLHIRPLAPHTFTGQLKALAESGTTPGVLVEGPYGRLSVDVAAQETVVLVAGGVGVTPMLSTLGYLAAALPPPLRRVLFAWAVQDESVLEAFDGQLRAAAAALAAAGVSCEITVHCTRAKRRLEELPAPVVKVVDLSGEGPRRPAPPSPPRRAPTLASSFRTRPPSKSPSFRAAAAGALGAVAAPLERVGSALVRAGSGLAHAGEDIASALLRLGSAVLPRAESAFAGEDHGDESDGEEQPSERRRAEAAPAMTRSSQAAAGAIPRLNSILRRRSVAAHAAEAPRAEAPPAPAVSLKDAMLAEGAGDVGAVLRRLDEGVLASSSDESEAAAPAPRAEPEPAKGPVRVVPGRPCFPELLARARDATGVPHFAVLTCGPAPLMAEVERAARAAEDARVAVHFHKETFQF